MSITRDEVEALVEGDPQSPLAQWLKRERAAYLKLMGDAATLEDFHEHMVERLRADPVMCRRMVDEVFTMLMAELREEQFRRP
jgi:hypothetical protein